MQNALTIDVEEWYRADFVAPFAKSRESQVEKAVSPILKLLKKQKTSATFFVLGEIAEKHPALLKEIYSGGHEIASHGFSHKRLSLLNEKSFSRELERTEKAVKNAVGEKPKGFRAPSFSLSNETIWALRVLEKRGYLYDSSVFPARTPLYGVPEAPQRIYKPSLSDVAREDSRGKIFEVPPSTLEFLGKRIPIAGGAYLRVLPYGVTKHAIKKINGAGRPAVVYFHPWETFTETPKPRGMPFAKSFVTYHARERMLSKIERLLRDFRFTTVEEILSGY